MYIVKCSKCCICPYKFDNMHSTSEYKITYVKYASDILPIKTEMFEQVSILVQKYLISELLQALEIHSYIHT